MKAKLHLAHSKSFVGHMFELIAVDEFGDDFRLNNDDMSLQELEATLDHYVKEIERIRQLARRTAV